MTASKEFDQIAQLRRGSCCSPATILAGRGHGPPDHLWSAQSGPMSAERYIVKRGTYDKIIWTEEFNERHAKRSGTPFDIAQSR